MVHSRCHFHCSVHHRRCNRHELSTNTLPFSLLQRLRDPFLRLSERPLPRDLKTSARDVIAWSGESSPILQNGPDHIRRAACLHAI